MRQEQVGYRASRLSLAGWSVALMAALIVAVSPAAGIASAEEEQMALRREQAAQDAKTARALLAFSFLTPTWLPPGYSLEHTAWFVPDERLGTTASSIDAWYSAPGQPFIHIWQTDNRELGEKDPVPVGDPMEIAGKGLWSVLMGVQGIDSDSTTVLSKRIGDGVTISVDSGIPIDQLTKVVQGLSADDSG